jgi:hypothetical protein
MAVFKHHVRLVPPWGGHYLIGWSQGMLGQLYSKSKLIVNLEMSDIDC